MISREALFHFPKDMHECHLIRDSQQEVSWAAVMLLSLFYKTAAQWGSATWLELYTKLVVEPGDDPDFLEAKYVVCWSL